MFRFLLTHKWGQWFGHITIWAMENHTIKAICPQSMVLWKLLWEFKGYTQLGGIGKGNKKQERLTWGKTYNECLGQRKFKIPKADTCMT